jgi:D-aminopeptidase
MTSEHHARTPAGKLRARGLGLPLPGTPGPFNAITDMASVEVGYSTIIAGDNVRTGVTAILPRGRAGSGSPCMAGYHSFNGNGEMTGTIWIEEAGELQTPITITNTASCGVTRDATLQWLVKNGIGTGQDWGLPVAAETYDGYLNDINGFHVKDHHVFEALDTAASGPLELGSAGGGTGMMTYEFKGGCGTASRQLTAGGKNWTLGTFVQSNFGRRHELTVLGVPVGRELKGGEFLDRGTGSIIAVIATDAPLLPHQLKRLARRVPVGLGRTGTIGHHSSGDIFLAFSTANANALASAGVRHLDALADSELDPLFEAVVETVEEAVLDAMICNEDMTGKDGFTIRALPRHDLVHLLKQAGKL